MKLYLIGSLRNPQIPVLAKLLRTEFPDLVVFDDWYAAGPHADDHWRDYEKARGHNLRTALHGFAAGHVFEYDKYHLETSELVCLVAPAGKSAAIELGYAVRGGSVGFMLLDEEPDRFDVMFKFAPIICYSADELVKEVRPYVEASRLQVQTLHTRNGEAVEERGHQHKTV